MGIASITRKQLLDLLRPGIDELFQEAYATFDPQLYGSYTNDPRMPIFKPSYEIEVDFE